MSLRLFLCGLSCLTLAGAAFAADVVWCGADGGIFTDAANWVGGVKPGAGDVCVFQPEGDLSVLVPNGSTFASGIRCASGNVTFTLNGSHAYTGFATATGTVEVADGASLTVNEVRIEQKNLTLRKTGGGAWYQKGRISNDSGSSTPCVILVEEGTLDCDTYLGIERLAVAADATCYIRGYNRVSGDCAVDLDGTLDISTYDNKMKISRLAGTGVFSASETSKLILTPAADCVFSGRFTGSLKLFVNASETGSFTVGAADTLAGAISVEAGSALRFAAGVGTFFAPLSLSAPADGSISLEDEDGRPVRLLATRSLTLTGKPVTGAGEIAVSNETTAVSLFVGDGTTDADLSSVGAVGSYGKGQVVYRNAQELVQSAALVGNGSVSVGQSGGTTAAVTLDDFAKKVGITTLYAPLTIAGGDAVAGYTGFDLKSATTLTIAGGLIGFNRVSAESTSYRTIPVPSGFLFGSVSGSKVVQTGGRLYQAGDYNAAPFRYELRGGELVTTAPVQPAYGATADDPSVYLLDGGTFGPALNNSIGEVFKTGNDRGNDKNPRDCAGRIRVLVGANGARLASFHDANKAFPVANFNLPLGAETAGADGGVTILGRAGYSFSQPLALSGDVRAQAPMLLPDAADTATTPQFFGAGSLLLRNAPLIYQACASDKALSLATAEGKSLSFEGACAIRFRRAADTSDKVAADPPAADAMSRQTLASGPLVRAGKGSVLFLWDGESQFVGEGDSASRHTVSGGVANGASGATALPVLGVKQRAVTFLAYDATDGFRPFTGYKAFSDETTDSSIVETFGSTVLAANATKEVGGAHLVTGASNDDASLTLAAGATLKVGNGTDPAVIAVETRGFYYNIEGAGTLDFGASEGIVCAPRTTGDYALTISCALAGSGGVTFAGVPESDVGCRRIRLSGANRHTGGTYVNAVRLEVANAQAFGVGDVHVGGGRLFGGRVAFDTALTVANDFHIAGEGIRNSKWDGFHSQGALEFNADATLTGSVELVEPAQVTVPTEGKTATLAGAVSGDALIVLKTGTSSALRLTGHNTYTGGTEVVSSVLALTQGDGAGTGAVTLDAGTLRFENAEAITFTNRIDGNGRVVLAGAGPVTFAGEALASLGDIPFATLAAGTAIDLADAAQNAYVPFLDGETDLGGQSLTVAGVAGSGTVANGTLTVTGEISPAGEGAVGTLAFAAGALVLGDGATFVCDVKGGAADRIVVADGLDLSKLALRAVRNDNVRGAPQTIVETTAGTLTGAFASVSLPRRSWSVRCGESSVTLDLFCGTVLIVR